MDSENIQLSGPDGPYLAIVDHENKKYQLTQIQREETGYYATVDSATSEVCSFNCIVDNHDFDSFAITLKPFAHAHLSPGIWDAPPKIFVLSDIEGNFDALFSLLVSHHVMDKDFHWTFGGNALVVLGDVMDRGLNVTPCLWLIYKLGEAAANQGGSVHFLLGNHEVMNLQSDLRFRSDKYDQLEQLLAANENAREAHKQFLVNHNNFLTGWIMNRNTIERIGDTLFVHAGISPEVFHEKIPIPKVNSIVRQYLKGQLTHAGHANLIMGSYGPLWYRGMVVDHGNYTRISESMVDEILDFYSASRLVVGHCVVDQVSCDFHGKVIRTDVLHSRSKFSPFTQGLIIEGDKVYRAYGNGGKEQLSGEKMVVQKKSELI